MLQHASLSQPMWTYSLYWLVSDMTEPILFIGSHQIWLNLFSFLAPIRYDWTYSLYWLVSDMTFLWWSAPMRCLLSLFQWRRHWHLAGIICTSPSWEITSWLKWIRTETSVYLCLGWFCGCNALCSRNWGSWVLVLWSGCKIVFIDHYSVYRLYFEVHRNKNKTYLWFKTSKYYS